jgi:predicted metalloprotease with PDZ domain
MAASVQHRRSAAALFTGAAIVVLAIFLVLRPLRLENPASAGARALLRLDEALGATVEPVDRVTASRLGLTAGEGDLVVTSVASRGPAAAAGIRVGDIIETIGGKPARNGLDDTELSSIEPVAILRAGKATEVNLQFVARAQH